MLFFLGTVGQVAYITFNSTGNSEHGLKEYMKNQLELVFPEILDDKNKFIAVLEKYQSYGTLEEYYEFVIKYFNVEI